MITSSALQEVQPYLLRLEDKMEALLANPAFLLLHVPEDGGTIRLVRPAVDPKLREELQCDSTEEESLLRYNALSHLWGIPNEEDKKYHMWDVGSFIHDENGDPVAPIPMREEKRRTLLALLKAEPGYWWIDVLCARVNTPLGIMGSIYRCCRRCYAMIDCTPEFMQMLEDKKIEQMYAEQEVIRMEHDKDKQRRECRAFVEKWSSELLLVRQAVQAEPRWLTRVWTWQEAALPCRTFAIPETGGDACMQNCMDLWYFTICLRYVEDTLMPITEYDQEDDAQAQTTCPGLRELHNEITDARYHRETIDLKGEIYLDYFADALTALGRSTRICMDPVDYVYGALGIFDMNVDRMEDHQAVWKNFLTELEQLIQWMLKNGISGQIRQVRSISISDKAYHVDLSKVQNMGEVYSGLLNVTFEEQDLYLRQNED